MYIEPHYGTLGVRDPAWGWELEVSRTELLESHLHTAPHIDTVTHTTKYSVTPRGAHAVTHALNHTKIPQWGLAGQGGLPEAVT